MPMQKEVFFRKIFCWTLPQILFQNPIGFDHLVKMVTAKFFHCKVTTVLSLMNKHLGGEDKNPISFCFLLSKIKSFLFLFPLSSESYLCPVDGRIT